MTTDPAAPTPEPESALVQAAPVAELPAVLVVEDDESLCYLLVFMLEREGFKVHLCQDGQQARTYIEGNASTAVVVLDIALPYLDGFALLRIMRDMGCLGINPRHHADLPIQAAGSCTGLSGRRK